MQQELFFSYCRSSQQHCTNACFGSGFEQANKYVIMDAQGNHIGYMAEQEKGLGNAMARQSFRTHRSFVTHVFDRNENEVLRVRLGDSKAPLLLCFVAKCLSSIAHSLGSIPKFTYTTLSITHHTRSPHPPPSRASQPDPLSHLDPCQIHAYLP